MSCNQYKLELWIQWGGGGYQSASTSGDVKGALAPFTLYGDVTGFVWKTYGTFKSRKFSCKKIP